MNNNFDKIKNLISNETMVDITIINGDGEFKIKQAVRGLNLHDFNYLVEIIPQKLLLKFIEGFSDKDVDNIEDYLVNETNSNFIEIYHSIICCGLGQYNEEETIERFREIDKLKIFKIILNKTLPKNDEEFKAVEEKVSELTGEDGSKKDQYSYEAFIANNKNINGLDTLKKLELYSEWKAKKKNEAKKGIDSDNKKIENFKLGKFENIEGLIMMANYLKINGHNTEYSDPFEYGIRKLISTYKQVKALKCDDMNDFVYSVTLGIAASFGEKNALELFKNQAENWRK